MFVSPSLTRESKEKSGKKNLVPGSEEEPKGGYHYARRAQGKNRTQSSATSRLVEGPLAKQKGRRIGSEESCERGGIRTLNQWLKRPLLCH